MLLKNEALWEVVVALTTPVVVYLMTSMYQSLLTSCRSSSLCWLPGGWGEQWAWWPACSSWSSPNWWRTRGWTMTGSARVRPSSWQSRAASSPRTGWRWRPGTGWSWRTSQSARTCTWQSLPYSSRRWRNWIPLPSLLSWAPTCRLRYKMRSTTAKLANEFWSRERKTTPKSPNQQHTSVKHLRSLPHSSSLEKNEKNLCRKELSLQQWVLLTTMSRTK